MKKSRRQWGAPVKIEPRRAVPGTGIGRPAGPLQNAAGFTRAACIRTDFAGFVMRTAALSGSAAICIKIADKIHKYIVNCDFSGCVKRSSQFQGSGI